MEGRAYRRLRALGDQVKPSWFVVFFKTLTNAWPTYRRMKSLPRHGLKNVCPFCSKGQDSIEHFCSCKFVRSVFEKHNVPCTDLLSFLCLDDSTNLIFVFKVKVKILFGLFKARNTLVCHPPDAPPISPESLMRAEGL